MATTKHEHWTAGDTEPKEISLTLGAAAEVTTGDISSVELYARKSDADTNHVDGVALTGVAASWDSTAETVTITGSFDPVGNGPSGADAFATGDEGTYYCIAKVTYSDGDFTYHPGKQNEWRVTVAPNYE